MFLDIIHKPVAVYAGSYLASEGGHSGKKERTARVCVSQLTSINLSLKVQTAIYSDLAEILPSI